MPRTHHPHIPAHVEAQLRLDLLIYFLEAKGVRGMAGKPPFETAIRRGVYTLDWLTYMRKALETAGLLTRIRGTTADVTLETSAMGRAVLNILSIQPAGD